MKHSITLIHALAESVGPIELAFAEHWPAAILRSILDDGLSQILGEQGVLDDAMISRFRALGRYAAIDEPSAILFTCSAFGGAIETVRRDLAPLPVRAPNEAMVRQASQIGGRIALIASFAPTLSSMPKEFPVGTDLVPVYVEGALGALRAGDAEGHDRLVMSAALATKADVYALSQFSLAGAAATLRLQTDKPVLTTPEAAVIDLRDTLASLE